MNNKEAMEAIKASKETLQHLTLKAWPNPFESFVLISSAVSLRDIHQFQACSS